MLETWLSTPRGIPTAYPVASRCGPPTASPAGATMAALASMALSSAGAAALRGRPLPRLAGGGCASRVGPRRLAGAPVGTGSAICAGRRGRCSKRGPAKTWESQTGQNQSATCTLPVLMGAACSGCAPLCDSANRRAHSAHPLCGEAPSQRDTC